MSPNRPRRLAEFSYVGLYQYFVTICTNQRCSYFRDEESARWMTAQIEQSFEPRQFAVIAYCVMPDHVHLLLEGVSDDSDFKATMRRWKSATGYTWKQRKCERLWQEGYYDRVLREHDSVISVVRYILDNPHRAGLTTRDASYPYMGSSRYSADELREAASDWSPYGGSSGGSKDPPLRTDVSNYIELPTRLP